MHSAKAIILAAVVCPLLPAFAFETPEALRAARARVLELDTPVIFNNDGCDAWNYEGPQPVTPESFLDIRTTALTNAAVDIVSYCPISSGFGGFTYRTRIGHILARANPRERSFNALPELLMWGTDPLEIVADFCRNHGMLTFFSMRMNDTHDQAHNPDAPDPYPLWSPFKERHPEWLTGSPDDRPAYGAWSSVDYTVPEIRDLAYRFAEEVCRHYDVDGIELDFFRHLSYFPSVAWGGEASEEECAMMTALVRRIREMTERVGMQRGKPFVLAVRVPDDPVYSRKVGLDYEQWMKEGLVDIIIGSGYFQLRPWEESVRLCRQYGVKFYAGLSEPRVSTRDRLPGINRRSDADYLGRAANAWDAGVDGLYSFNEYRPHRRYLRIIGDRNALRFEDKAYYATVRDGDPGRYLAGGREHLNLTMLTPDEPLMLPLDRPVEIPVRIAEEPAAERGYVPDIECLLLADPRLSAEELQASFNGHPLVLRPRGDNGWFAARLRPDWLESGWNRVAVHLRSDDRRPAPETAWDVEKIFTSRFTYPEQKPWRRLFAGRNYVEEIRDGALYLADQGSGPQDFPHFIYPWLVAPGERIAVEAEVKVIESDDPLAVCLRFADGRSVEYLTLQADGLALHFAGRHYAMDTTAAFHTYRVVVEDRDIRVYVDGELRIDAPGAYTTPADAEEHALPLMGNTHWNQRSMLMGSATAPGRGSALWRAIRMTSNARRALRDMLVHVRYETDGSR